MRGPSPQAPGRIAAALRELGRAAASPPVVCVALLAAVVTGTILASGAEPAWAYCTIPLVGLLYCLAGEVALRRRPSNAIGRLLVLGGIAWLAAGLRFSPAAVPAAIGVLCETLPVAVTIHLMFAFPSGRLGTAVDRVAVVATYLLTVVLVLPTALFDAADPRSAVLLVADRPDLAQAGADSRTAVGLALSVLLLVSLRRRYRAMSAGQRRAFLPFLATGALVLFVIPPVMNVLPELSALSVVEADGLARLTLAALPLATLATMLRGGFSRTLAAQELAARLDGGGPAPAAGLRTALAEALGDPSLELAFDLDGKLVDSDGRPFRPRVRGNERGRHAVAAGNGARAVVLYDRRLVLEPADVDAAAGAAAIWLERERLVAELGATEAALRRSRRLIEGAERERRRIAQDLHDGLASRLVLIAVKAQRVAGEAGAGAAARASLAGLQSDLDAAIEELRALTRGVMPAGLIEIGLAAAIEDLAIEAPIATRVAVEGLEDRLPEQLELAAYMVVAEAIANAVKHSGAERLEIGVSAERDLLRIEVRDDGEGGARPGGGAGLTGIAARAEAFGGGLRIESPPGGGTLLAVHFALAASAPRPGALGYS